MIKLFEVTYQDLMSTEKALEEACRFTGFTKEDFRCEVIKEPSRKGLFRREPGIFRCWYEYEEFDCDRQLEIGDADFYFDNARKEMLVITYGTSFELKKIDYSDLEDYEIIVKTGSGTKEGGNSQESGKLMVRLKFYTKDPVEIDTCAGVNGVDKIDNGIDNGIGNGIDNGIEINDEEWQNIMRQGREAEEYFKKLLGRDS